MRLSTTRITPLSDEELTPELRALVAPTSAVGKLLNFHRMLARVPKAAPGFMGWGRYILSADNDLPRREREILILRPTGRWWPAAAIIPPIPR